MSKNGESSFGNNKLGWPYLKSNSLLSFVVDQLAIDMKLTYKHNKIQGIKFPRTYRRNFHRIANVGNIHQGKEIEMQKQ